MASNFSSLRSSRSSLLAKLSAEAKKESAKGGGSTDERFWKLTVDPKTKVGYAKLRFLPAPQNEELPWVRVFSHAFQGPGGGWFIENCPTTNGNQPCPLCKENSILWKSGSDDDKTIVRLRKRKLQFISNVLVIEDSAKPENNGKVFLFKYGVKIHDKIKEAIEPEFPDQTPLNPFDLWEGAEFKLKSRDYQGYQNYDKSEFAAPSEACGGDEAKLEEIWLKAYSLTGFVAADQFKSYEDLEKRVNDVISGAAGRGKAKTAAESIKAETEVTAAEVDEQAAEVRKAPRKPTQRPVAKAKVEAAAPAAAEPEDDDIKAFFGGLDED